MSHERLRELFRRAASPDVSADLGLRIRARAARRRHRQLTGGSLAVLAAALVVGMLVTSSDEQDALVAAVPPTRSAPALPDPQATAVGICLAGSATPSCREVTDVPTIARLESEQRAARRAEPCTPRRQQTYVVTFISPNTRAIPQHVPEVCGPIIMPASGQVRPVTEAFRQLVVSLRPGRQTVDQDHLVKLNHCGLDPVTFDGRTWTVDRHAFDATNAPPTFSGRGRLQKIDETHLEYVDHAGARLTFTPVQLRPPPPDGCA